MTGVATEACTMKIRASVAVANWVAANGSAVKQLRLENEFRSGHDLQRKADKNASLKVSCRVLGKCKAMFAGRMTQ